MELVLLEKFARGSCDGGWIDEVMEEEGSERWRWEGATRRRRTTVDMNSLTLHFYLTAWPVYPHLSVCRLGCSSVLVA
jgi:hypothetical protein